MLRWRHHTTTELKIGQWTIRSWERRDEARLAQFANNRKVWINLRDSFPYPYTRQDAREWIIHAEMQDPESFYAIASDEGIIGGIGVQLQADVYRRSGEIGYWLGEPFWGKGIATKAVMALTDYAFERFDLVRIYGIVFDWNPASARVLQKAGYTYEARLRKSITKDGRTIDQLIYATIRE